MERNYKISLWSATLLSASCMMGSGWLFSAQLAAKQAGNYAFIAWIIAACFVLMVGVCIAQVAQIYPLRGITTRMSTISHNSLFGLSFSFANWFGIIFSVATEAQATTQYLSSAIGSQYLVIDGQLMLLGKLVALFIVGLYLLINFYGIRLLARVNNVVTTLKIITPLLTVAVLIIASLDTSRTTSNFTLGVNSEYGIGGAFSSIVGAGLVYAFNGFQTAVAFSSEIKNPKRNVPLSIFLSIAIVLLIYLGVQFAFMQAIPADTMTKGWQGLNFNSPLLDVALLLNMHVLSIILIADSITSPSGTGYSYLGAAGRMLTAMGNSGQAPKWIATLNPTYNFSRRSILINWTIAALILLFSTGWAALMVLVTGFNIIGYMAAPVSLGAEKPKTRIYGALVFLLITLVMYTLGTKDLCLIASVITTLNMVYMFTHRSWGYKALIYCTFPVVAYFWVLALIPLIPMMVISLMIFTLMVHKRYVSYCKSLTNINLDKYISS